VAASAPHPSVSKAQAIAARFSYARKSHIFHIVFILTLKINIFLKLITYRKKLRMSAIDGYQTSYVKCAR
jgi:hypothetical protein